MMLSEITLKCQPENNGIGWSCNRSMLNLPGISITMCLGCEAAPAAPQSPLLTALNENNSIYGAAFDVKLDKVRFITDKSEYNKFIIIIVILLRRSERLSSVAYWRERERAETQMSNICMILYVGVKRRMQGTHSRNGWSYKHSNYQIK